MTKNAVALKNENAVVAFDDSMFAGVEIGNEEIVAAQYRMPLLKIVEPLSKALIEGDALYIPGAKAGDIIDTASSSVVGTEIEFLPVKASTVYIEKSEDDKVVARHENRSILDKCTWRTETGKKKGTFLPNGNEIQETIYLFGINISSGYDWCAIPFNRGRLPAAQTILYLLNKAKMSDGKTAAPFFYNVWDMKVTQIKSSDGKPFRTWKGAISSRLQDREDADILFSEANRFREALANKETVVDDTDHDRQAEDAVPF